MQLSQGNFALILVRCNYQHLRAQILPQVREQSPMKLKEIRVSAEETQLLPMLQEAQTPEDPTAFMVLGLESVRELEEMLKQTNQVRDRFGKLPFPLVLWSTDEVLQKLTRFAPDFKNWAGPSIKFAIATDELIEFVKETTESIFARLLEEPPGALFRSPQGMRLFLDAPKRWELHAAKRDLGDRGITLPPELHASWEFILGQYERACNAVENALTHYQNSLKGFQEISHWQEREQPGSQKKLPSERFSLPQTPSIWNRKSSGLHPDTLPGVVCFHLGVCYREKAQSQPPLQQNDWEQAKAYFKAGIEWFDRAGQFDVAMEFVQALGDTIDALDIGEELQAIAAKALNLNQPENNGMGRASDTAQPDETDTKMRETSTAIENWTDAL